ncbi:SDR family NAD(P)-dependent oxidoreductase [Streptomyces sp. UG1]|uniref:SDR family NAD(P)-dependent oxidoreductase n=1 Tax=Streptomyces sp. UG1 TaxID=3417652 RepID=UPI003CEA5323
MTAPASGPISAGETPERPVAVVTAAGGMMGTAISTLLATSGHRLVLNDRRDCLDALAAQLRGRGSEVETVVADVADTEGAEATVRAALLRWGRVDVLVNVAGGIKGPVDNPLWDITAEQWSRTVSVNLDSAFFCTQQAAKAMMAHGSGRIVNVASTSWAGSPLHAHYAAAKAGLVSLTRSAAQQLGNPLGRPNEPEDIAEAVAFLLGNGARNISGQLLTVAGGLNPAL